jgi:segregation and condensation protein B
MEMQQLKNIIEAFLLGAARPLSVDQLLIMLGEDEIVDRSLIQEALSALQAEYETRGIALVQVGSGYRVQIRETMQPWVSRLWEEKPARYSRALLETLSLIAYRQPITRGEIEEVRGVAVSTTIMKTLQEREWVHIIGHREVPGRPAMYGTTRKFLDYFSLKGLSDLPSLAELRDLSAIGKDLELDLSEIPGLELEVVADSGEAEVESGLVAEVLSELATEEPAVAEDIKLDAEAADSDNIATLH